MRCLMVGAATLGATLMAVPSHAATNIECMDSGYSAQQNAIFEAYYAGFTIGSLDEDESSDAHIPPIGGRAGDCAELHGWSPDAIMHAIYYRLSGLLANALERNTPLTPEQMVRLNEALANADQARLREILGPGIETSMNGEEGPEMSEQDEIFLGTVVMGAGLPLDQAHSEYAGALLGARMMAEIAIEKFTNN